MKVTLLTSNLQTILYSHAAPPAEPFYPDDNMVTFYILLYGLIATTVCIASYVVCAVFYMKLFAKANVPAWKAWVPVVNLWKFLELGGYHGALSLLFVAAPIPFLGQVAATVGFVFSCMAAYQIGLKLGKESVWVVLYIFVAIVWLGIMAFDKSMWNDSLGNPAQGPERPPSWPPYGGGVSTGGYPLTPSDGYPPASS